MSKAKYSYKVIINKQIKSRSGFVYSYGNTRDISLTVEKNCATISFDMSVEYDIKDCFSKPIIRDAYKKAHLVHILLFGSNIKIHNVFIEMNGRLEEVEEDRSSRLFSLIVDNETIDYRMKLNNIKTIINKILNTPINRTTDSRIACVYAFIMAERQQYAVQEFIFLWMSFNAFYNKLYYCDTHNNDLDETKRLRNLVKHYYGIEKNIKIEYKEWKKIKDKIANQMMVITEYWNEEPVTYELVNERLAGIITMIFNRKSIELESEYCYLLTGLSYYFRCNIIHGNKPLKLLCFEDERELKCLRLINSLLENFLKDNMSDICL